MADVSAGLLGNILHHMSSLDQEDHSYSVRLLGDLLIANSAPLGLCNHGDEYFKVLVSYADSLYFDLQLRRALHFYKEALKVGQMRPDYTEMSESESEVKWKMYKCHMKLKEKQEAFDMLTSIPLRHRDSKVALALGRLYHHFKNESREAQICYKMALSMCPLALEAAVGLLSLGVGLSEVILAARPETSKEESGVLSPGSWLYSWLEVQAHIARNELSSAVSHMGTMEKQGFAVSAETNCQLARCLAKLGRTDAAKTLFATAHAQDPYVLTHMDTYSRLLTSKAELERLSTHLLYASRDHAQPWVVKAWQMTKGTGDLFKSMSGKVNTLLQKAIVIEPRNAETTFLQGTILQSRKEQRGAVKKFIETVQIDPLFFEAFECIIRIYLDMDLDNEAITLARTATKKLPISRQYYLEGLALSNENITKAKLSLERSVRAEREPTFDKAVLELSQLYNREGKIEKAAEILSNHLKVHQSARLHCELGDHLFMLKRHLEADEQYRQAIRLDGSMQKAKDRLGRVALTMSDSPMYHPEEDTMGSDDSVQDLSADQYDQEWI